MSNVHRRFRKETDLQFLVTAQELQFELTKFVMREKNVPKKWRLIIAQPLIAKVDELLDNLNYANYDTKIIKNIMAIILNFIYLS